MMMHFAVYWQHDDEIECVFHTTEQAARQHVSALIKQTEDLTDEGVQPDWDITLLKVIGEVQQIPFDGDYRLKEVV